MGPEAIEVRPVGLDQIPDMAALFGTDASVDSCWCMWFIIPVKEYHAGGGAANRAKFCERASACSEPMGLLAYMRGVPVGWCAAGPRSRYERAVRTPTLKGIDPSENDRVWLVPCFFVRPEVRGQGVSQRLLQAAVDLARQHAAVAIEGFPLAAGKRRSADLQVGAESVFRACGFAVLRRPTGARVVMRRELPG